MNSKKNKPWDTFQSEGSRSTPEEELKNYEERLPLDQGIKDLIVKCTLNHALSDKEAKGLKLFAYRFLNARIVNSVCPFLTNQPIDRQTLYENALKHNLEAKIHSKFTGISIRYGSETNSFTAIYFPSGAINCVGVKVEGGQGIDYVQKTLLHHAPLLLGRNDLGNYRILNRRISNRVIALKTPSSIVLDRLQLFLDSPYWRQCKYVTEIFPGLIYKIPNLNCKVLYFTTGSMICCGITSKYQQGEICKNMIEKFSYYLGRRKREASTKNLGGYPPR